MTPDLILTGARIATMDPARPQAQAIAMAGGRILGLGSDAEIVAAAGPGTRRIDAGGRRVLPAFQDAHIHLAEGGVDLVTAVPLFEAASHDALIAALRAHAASSDLPVVFGSGWQGGTFPPGTLHRGHLDAAVPGRPCFTFDSSAHMACLNSAALAAAGIGRDTPDPPNGTIQRDAAGEPTGLLLEDAAPWALARLPPLPADMALRGALAAMAHANRHGITGIIDARVVQTNLDAYAAALAGGCATLRVTAAALVRPADTPATAVERLADWRATHRHPDLMVTSAKFFLDGVIENGTAAFLAPTADTGTNAPVMFPQDHLNALVAALDAARFQCHFHVIGDAAASAALDALDHAAAANGVWPSLPQLAHLQLVDAADIPRLAALGAMANIQPLWARHDPAVPDLWMEAIGPARLPQTYPFRQIADAGAPLVLSSDWTVSTLNPFPIIETAITRQPQRAEGQRPPFLPAERLNRGEALHAYTVNAAAACWRSHLTGRLAPGLSADLIVTDRDPLTCPVDEIGETRVLLTLFKGAAVHRDPDFPG
jgi:hypothetical protein